MADGFFNRRYATYDRCDSNYPALKDRAKLITTLRVGEFGVLATFEATPEAYAKIPVSLRGSPFSGKDMNPGVE